MDSERLFSGRLETRFADIERRLAALEGAGHRAGVQSAEAAVDGLGAPLDAGSWPVLREAVKAAISDIGVVRAARIYGASPETFKSVVYRTREPGYGAQARMANVVRLRPRPQLEAPAETPVLALPYLGGK